MTSTPRTTLYLVRHGATASNESTPPVLQGSGIDSPLSDLGRRQATATGNLLSSLKLDAIFSSPMSRAVSTAEAIAGPHRLTVSTLADLHEIDVGQWEGMDWESIFRQTPDEYRLFMEDSGINGYLGGESYQNVLDRVLPVFTDLLSEYRGHTIAVVAHKAVNRSILASLLGLEMRKAKDLPQDNCCVNIITAGSSSPRLETLNSSLHLKSL